MNFDSDVTIKKKDLENWVSGQMNECIRIIINPSLTKFIRLDALMKFEILNQLRTDAELNQPNMNQELYRLILALIRESRHWFEIATYDENPFSKIEKFWNIA